MKDIIQKFCNKIGIEKRFIFCLYSGNILNEEITLLQLTNSIKCGKKVRILVNKIPLEGNYANNSLSTSGIKKSPQIICPEYKNMAIIKFKNYKISFKCINNHIIKNKFLKDFEKTQMIDEPKIICDICKQKNVNNSYNNQFFICLNCQKNLCPLCNYYHDKNHSIIQYQQKNFICPKHEDNYFLYCYTCKKDLCALCENEHQECETISLGKLIPNKKDLDKRMNELKYNINELKDEIKKINDVLNIFSENMNIYYNINNDINNSFNIRLKNFETLNNIKEINNIDILKDITEIINEEDIGNKFKQIFKIYNMMNTKDENNYFNDNINQLPFFRPKNVLGPMKEIHMGDMNNMNNEFNNMNINPPGMVNNNFNQDMNKNIINSNNFIQNMPIPNMMMNNNFIPMNNFMINSNFQMQNMMMNYMNQNEDYMKGNIMTSEEMKSNSDLDNSGELMINVNFKEINGDITTLIVSPYLTIDELLKKYFQKVGGDSKKFCFLFNARELKFEDHTSVKKIFRYCLNPLVIVHNRYDH